MKRIAVLDLAARRTAHHAEPLATPRSGPPTTRLAAPLAALLGTVLGTLLGTLLVACASSPPSRFYSLNAVEPEAVAPAAVASSAAPTPSQPTASLQAPVRVAAVHIPPVLDRTEIVRRGPGNDLQISGLNRWGAPLDEMVQRVLTQDLLERLPAGRVVLPSSPAPKGTGRIVVDILQLQSDAAGAVVFEGSWSLLPPGSSAPSLIRDIHYSEATRPGDYGDQAAAMSRMLGRLADDIARSLQQH